MRGRGRGEGGAEGKGGGERDRPTRSFCRTAASTSVLAGRVLCSVRYKKKIRFKTLQDLFCVLMCVYT